MEKPQPTNIPPIVRIPGIPPQQVAGKHYVYIPPTFKRVSTPPQQSPLPPQYTQQRLVYTAPALIPPPGYQNIPVKRQFIQMPDGHIAPAIRLPAKPQKPLAGQPAPQTPGLLSFANGTKRWSPVIETPPGIPISPSQPRLPITSAFSIPGYYPTRFKREEPGIGETLLGCGILLLIGAIALAILCYLLI